MVRSRPFLADFFSPFQSSFIPGCHAAADSRVILTEAMKKVRNTKKKKRTKGPAFLKLDLEKAYDRIGWTRRSPRALKFPSCFIGLTTQKYFFDKLLPQFRPSRSIHRDDAISPYLFIIRPRTVAKPVRRVKNPTINNQLFICSI